jgi:hypothetical protein
MDAHESPWNLRLRRLRTEAARQMASSVGDGVTAAIAAAKYVDEQKAQESADNRA